MYFCGGDEEPKRCDGKEKANDEKEAGGDAAAAFAYAVASVGAPCVSMYFCG